MAAFNSPSPNNLRHGPDCAFRSVMDAASVAVIVAGRDGYCVYQNPAAERLLGYDPESLYARHVAELVRADPAWLAAQLEYLRRREVWSGRLLLNHRNGTAVSVSVNCFSETMEAGLFYVGLITPNSLARGATLEGAAAEGPGYGLTSRELRVLQLMAEGFCEEEAALLLRMTLPDIHVTTRSVMAKIGSPSRTEACVRAIKAGLLR